jgi:hypothetical protein
MSLQERLLSCIAMSAEEPIFHFLRMARLLPLNLQSDMAGLKMPLKLSQLKKVGARYLYRGRLWSLDKPIRSTAKGKKMTVLASKKIAGEIYVRLIHFGALGYGHNYSQKAKRSYLARSAGIRNKLGELTKDDPWSANYWARRILWPPGPARGPKTT